MLKTFIVREDNQPGIEKSINRIASSILLTKKAIIIPNPNQSNTLSFSFHLNVQTVSPLHAVCVLLKQKSIFQIKISLTSLSEGYVQTFASISTIEEVVGIFNLREDNQTNIFNFDHKKKELKAEKIFVLDQQHFQDINFFKFLEVEFNKVQKGLISLYQAICKNFQEKKIHEDAQSSNINSGRVSSTAIIKNIKEYYEKIRKNRKKATKINLIDAEVKSVDVATRLVKIFGWKCFEKQKKYCNEEEIKRFYEAIVNKYKDKKLHEDKKKKIVTTMEILEEKQIEQFRKGSFGVISKVEVTYLLKESIYSQVNNFLAIKSEDSTQNEQTKYTSIFVKKEPANQAEEIFRNEKTILFYMRNEVCKKIGQFYFETSSVPSESQSLYSNFYSKEFYLPNFKPKYWLKLVLDLALGLEFFQNVQILHRDLKPSNIMISKQNEVKIIDFGSAYPIHNSAIDPKQMHSELNCTKGYYIPYESESLPSSVKQKFTKQEYQRHEYFDVYSFGRILDRFYGYSEENLNIGGDYMIRDNIRYLISKCTQKNPDDRLAPMQIICFLTLLVKVQKIE